MKAIEARMTKKTTLENSKYAKDLFPSDKELFEFLDATSHGGYLHSRSKFKPMGKYEEATHNRVNPRGILQVIQDLFK